jgi:hypothetical protein
MKISLFAFLELPGNRFRTAVTETKELNKIALLLTFNKKGF